MMWILLSLVSLVVSIDAYAQRRGGFAGHAPPLGRVISITSLQMDWSLVRCSVSVALRSFRNTLVRIAELSGPFAAEPDVQPSQRHP